MDKLYFLTSSKVKLLHSRYLARFYDVSIEPQVHYGVTYHEPRNANREELLALSFQDAMERWAKTVSKERNVFFIEDTSVSINALSVGNEEFPGLDIKFWMSQMTFERLDRTLKDAGGDRGATVRSDVVLYLPPEIMKSEGIDKPYLIFTGFTAGTIIESETVLETDQMYPWLDNRSFNKWFVPHGSDRPLGALSIEKASLFDFRNDSIGGALRFLHGKHVIAKKRNVGQGGRDVSLPFSWPPLVVICGLPCSGKTITGTFLADRNDYFHLEASDFMRLAFFERSSSDAGLRLDEFAAKALKESPSIVLDQVLDEIGTLDDWPVVITGFRSPNEVSGLIDRYSGALDVVALYLTAGEEIRFLRCIERDREDAPSTLDAFRCRDNIQRKMGLDGIASLNGLVQLKNEGSIQSLQDNLIEACGLKDPFRIEERPPHYPLDAKLEQRILSALSTDDAFLTTTEIAHRIERLYGDRRTNKNNVSRYFNQRLKAYFRIKDAGGKRKYRLSQTGQSKARHFQHALASKNARQDRD
jgi:cytidylate kinase/inosine/xanthosine triphosphate pyrophosphatase family protein